MLSWESSVGIEITTDWMARIQILTEARGFLYSTVSRLALGPAQPPIQWVQRALSLGIQWPGREDDHSPPSSAEVKNSGAIPPFSDMSSCHSA
jgi:hypothetical protein